MKNITPKKFSFSEVEKKHLLKAWIAISLAFAIAFRPYGSFLVSILMSGFTIGIAFLLHEIAHKYVAIKYRCSAEFRSNNNMLILMLIVSLFGIIFAAPGAVQIFGHVTKERYGKIALAGPLTNILLAIIFLPLIFLEFGTFLTISFRFGLLINSWLALFNTIPIPGFDGHKILNWNRKVFYLTLVASFIMVAISQNV